MNFFSTGSNSKGQLGTGNLSDISAPQLVLRIELIDVQIGCGSNHSLILIKNTDVCYVSGDNSVGQLGLDCGSLATFTKYKLPCQASRLHCGWNSSFITTKEGCIFMTGSIGKLHRKVWEQLQFKDIVKISSTINQAYFLDSKGTLFDQEGIIEESVADIAGSSLCLLTLSISGLIQIRGKSKHIIGIDVKDYNIVELYSGWSFAAFRTSSNEVYMWGRRDLGQIPSSLLNPDQTHVDPSTLTKLNFQSSQLYLATESGCTIIESDLWVWGWNEHGNCGVGNQFNVYECKKVASQVIAAGCQGGHMIYACKVDQ